MTDKIRNFNDFIPLALRTESQIELVKTNRSMFVALLLANIAIGEVLDAFKKQIFYGNDSKLRQKSLNEMALALMNVESVMDTLDNDELSLEQELPVNPRILHGLLGTITESAELSEILLNAINTETPVDPVHVTEELADGDWYKAILVDELNIDYNQGLTNVINKLRVRYPEKFSNELAANRNLEAERVALEGK